MKPVVVLGTGTGVGKTYVSCALARGLRALAPELEVAALKPVETGVGAEAADARSLANLSSVRLPEPHPIFAFADPISPHLAARRAGAAPITGAAISAWFETWMSGVAPHVVSRMCCIVETAGGAFSPLASGFTNHDLALRLEPALLVLVAPDSLGVLHDVTATLAACRARGRAPDLLVLSEARPPDASSGTNAAELAALRIAEPCTTVRRGADVSVELARAVLELLGHARTGADNTRLRPG